MNRLGQDREKWQDLELRLAPLSQVKDEQIASRIVRGADEIIIIEDDDEEEQTRSFFSYANSSMPAISEGDLDLRLAVGASNGNTRARDTNTRKCDEASRSQFTEVKLRCAICMDTMKEETSTLCGHIFCKTCITNTILALKRCPTCRKELSISSIHRIFLPGES